MRDYSDVQLLPTRGVFKGMVAGDARVQSGSDLEIRGMISGDLIIDAGSTVRVGGMIAGRILNDGSDVVIKGMIGG